jgi:hypothetical protein
VNRYRAAIGFGRHGVRSSEPMSFPWERSSWHDQFHGRNQAGPAQCGCIRVALESLEDLSSARVGSDLDPRGRILVSATFDVNQNRTTIVYDHTGNSYQCDRRYLARSGGMCNTHPRERSDEDHEHRPPEPRGL